MSILGDTACRNGDLVLKTVMPLAYKSLVPVRLQMTVLRWFVCVWRAPGSGLLGVLCITGVYKCEAGSLGVLVSWLTQEVSLREGAGRSRSPLAGHERVLVEPCFWRGLVYPYYLCSGPDHPVCAGSRYLPRGGAAWAIHWPCPHHIRLLEDPVGCADLLMPVPLSGSAPLSRA